jgi:succinate dehydrogenase/fumarate reductase flavoprotein subunit
MKTLMATLVAVAAVTAAAPVAAQPYRDYDRGDRYEQRGEGRYDQRDRWERGGQVNFDQRRHRIDRRIERNAQTGALTRREAIRLSEQLNDIERLQNRYERNGLTRWEVVDLDRRLDGLEQRVYAQARDNDYAYRR